MIEMYYNGGENNRKLFVKIMKAIAAAVPDVKHYFSHVEFSNECKINNEIMSFTTRRPYIFSRGNIDVMLN